MLITCLSRAGRVQVLLSAFLGETARGPDVLAQAHRPHRDRHHRQGGLSAFLHRGGGLSTAGLTLGRRPIESLVFGLGWAREAQNSIMIPPPPPPHPPALQPSVRPAWRHLPLAGHDVSDAPSMARLHADPSAATAAANGVNFKLIHMALPWLWLFKFPSYATIGRGRAACFVQSLMNFFVRTVQTRDRFRVTTSAADTGGHQFRRPDLLAKPGVRGWQAFGSRDGSCWSRADHVLVTCWSRAGRTLHRQRVPGCGGCGRVTAPQ